MAGSATVGILKVLLSADSATITSDLAKARKAVAPPAMGAPDAGYAPLADAPGSYVLMP